jgi:hypothetical protein
VARRPSARQGRIRRRSRDRWLAPASDDERYEAVPYQFHALEGALSKDPELAVNTVLGWYREGEVLFRFEGGRLFGRCLPWLAATAQQ